jgi:hypothetical protein
VALAPAARTISVAMFHPLDVMFLMSGLIYCSLLNEGYCSKSIITICKFYKMHDASSVGATGGG